MQLKRLILIKICALLILATLITACGFTTEQSGEFDAFIVGPSIAGAFSSATLERHTDLRWSNLFNRNADIDYMRQLSKRLIETYEPEILLLVVPVSLAASNAAPNDNTSKLPFENPQRNAEAIGNFDEFSMTNEQFTNMRMTLSWNPQTPLPYIDKTVNAIANILELANRHGTQVIVIIPPMLSEQAATYNQYDVLEFYEKLASVTYGIVEFWDFSRSAISYDIRYFYDTTYFRTHVGEMIIERIFDYNNLWFPDDFGVFVTPANADEVAARFSEFEPPNHRSNERIIPILMYHDIIYDDFGNVPPELFAEHMRALYDAGFTAVSLAALKDFVFRGIELPERTVVITFDDGYLTNYTYAFPILQEFGFHAAIFPMGISFGRDTHFYSGRPIRPRFGETETRTMVESGLIEIQSHTYNMHHAESHDPPPFRRGILRMEFEPEYDYVNFLRNDIAQMRRLLEPMIGNELFALAYPFGFFDELSAAVLLENGIFMTFSTNHDFATVIKGVPQSLLEMNRFSIDDGISGAQLIQKISN